MSKPQILIVDDDLDLADMLDAYFRVQDYSVLTAAWGKEALKMSQAHELALIVLDIHLPDIDGYEVCRQLRLQRHSKNVPIIFLTEKSDRVDKLQGLELGVVDYITKPFDIHELRLRIRNAIERTERKSALNSVTDLPEGQAVDERLTEMLKGDKEWSLLKLSLDRLDRFREKYGFAATDDVLRAVVLIIKNAIREHGNDDDFIGHLDSERFVLLTSAEKVAQIQERVENRIRQSQTFFYPLSRPAPETQANETSDVIALKCQIISHDTGEFRSTDDLKKALAEEKPPAESPTS